MNIADVFRIISIVFAAVTFGMAFANLVVSFRVLAPTPLSWSSFWGSGGGFIWLHVLAVAVAFQGAMIWGIVEVALRLDQSPMTFRPPLLLFLSVLISVGYIIIFRVELSRLRLLEDQRALINSEGLL